MKKVLSVMLIAALVTALFSGTVFAGNGNGNGNGYGKENGKGKTITKEFKEFKDIKNHWGKKAVEKMQFRGILGGYSDGTFQPDRVLTQGELAVILVRLLDELQPAKDQDRDTDEDQDEDSEELSDVPDWAKFAVKKGFKHKYLNMKRFHSQVQCDRLTAAVAIAKALKFDPVTDFNYNPFKDRGLMNDEDFGYLLALYQAGYINGYPDGNFNPDRLLSRAHIASIIAKILEDKEAGVTDDKAPVWPSGAELTVSSSASGLVTIVWPDATDNEEVAAYKLYIDGELYKTLDGDENNTNITGLKEDTEYTFKLRAADKAGNLSDSLTKTYLTD